MAAHSSFGAACRSSNMVQLRRRDGLSIPIHKDLAPLVAVLMDLTEMMGYDIKPGWTWGYACRYISGTTQRSNHSWGTAVDINAPVNPYASAEWHRANANSYPFGLPRRSDIPQKVFELWERNGFRLGVKYQTKPDPMHFEFMESVAAARIYTAKLRTFLTSPPSVPKPPPPPPEDYDMQTITITDAVGKFFLHMPDGCVRITPREAFAYGGGGVPNVKMTTALFDKAYRGARAISLNDPPKMET